MSDAKLVDSTAESPLANPGTRTFVVSLAVWNPVLAATISFVFGGTNDFWRNWFVSLVISEVVALQCFAAAHLMRWLEVRLHHLRRRPAPEHHIGWYFIVAGVAMPFALPLGFYLGGATARWLGFPWEPLGFASYRSGFGFGMLVVLLLFFQRTRSDAREAAREAENRVRRLEAARLRAQLSALTAEMNPHLLFNALNTVASLIPSDPARAEEVVLQLADLYRKVLRASGQAMHTLGDELALCEAYLKIEQARFGERLMGSARVAADIDPSAIQVPVLILQPLVENAVKHGISPRARGGRVDVNVARGVTGVEVCVADDGVGFGRSTREGMGKAMANCKERLRLTYGARGSLEVLDDPAGGTRVLVKIPAQDIARGGAQEELAAP